MTTLITIEQLDKICDEVPYFIGDKKVDGMLLFRSSSRRGAIRSDAGLTLTQLIDVCADLINDHLFNHVLITARPDAEDLDEFSKNLEYNIEGADEWESLSMFDTPPVIFQRFDVLRAWLLQQRVLLVANRA